MCVFPLHLGTFLPNCETTLFPSLFLSRSFKKTLMSGRDFHPSLLWWLKIKEKARATSPYFFQTVLSSSLIKMLWFISNITKKRRKNLQKTLPPIDLWQLATSLKISLLALLFDILSDNSADMPNMYRTLHKTVHLYSCAVHMKSNIITSFKRSFVFEAFVLTKILTLFI